MQYRKVLYANYHTTQSGRASGTDAASLFKREKGQFAIEILPLMGSMPKDSRIFDMGCGSGSLLKLLQENGFTQTLGMDLSQEQVDIARDLGVQNVLQGDALQHLLSGNHTYDLVCGMDIIEHFSKDELVELLQGIRGSLSPGGKAIFRTPNMDAPMATVFANGDFTHENYLNGSSAQQVFSACGFRKVNKKASAMRIANPLKEFFRKICWALWTLQLKLILFASARSSKDVIFTPNMIIIAEK